MLVLVVLPLVVMRLLKAFTQKAGEEVKWVLGCCVWACWCLYWGEEECRLID